MHRSKVGVITLYGQNNYGNRLQNYATLAAYSSMGYTAEALVFDRVPVRQRFKRIIRNILSLSRDAAENECIQARLEAFNRFACNIPIKFVQSVDGLQDYYRFFSVGSDQVWNPNYIKGREDWFYLSFCHPDQRIALSPSIGLDELNRLQSKSLYRGIKDYPTLSIREYRGAQLIADCTGRDATVLCDPTLTVSADEWDRLSDNRLTPGSPYVFAYVLGDKRITGNLLDIVTKQGSIPVIMLSDRVSQGDLPAGPAEFISLIENAKYVITDSFHAAVFASIFEKPLTIVERSGGAGMFSRLETLTDMLNIKYKIYGNVDFDFTLAANYEGVSRRIERERAKFMKYLEACLSA